MNVVIAGIETAIGASFAARYRALGANVSNDEAAPETVDLLIVADGFVAAARKATDIRRPEFEAGLASLTYRPFALANQLRPQLTASSGKAVLITRTLAGMTIPDSAGHYLERPFRAAAHALWRTMSVEWQPDGIACAIIAIDDASEVDTAITTIAAMVTPPLEFCVLTTAEGQPLGW